MNINPELIYKRLNEVGQEWVKAQARAELYAEAIKPELSTLVIRFIEDGCKSMTEAEARARASQEYKDLVKKMVQAKEHANECRVKYDSAKSWFEALRSEAATLRQEMKL